MLNFLMKKKSSNITKHIEKCSYSIRARGINDTKRWVQAIAVEKDTQFSVMKSNMSSNNKVNEKKKYTRKKIISYSALQNLLHQKSIAGRGLASWVKLWSVPFLDGNLIIP